MAPQRPPGRGNQPPRGPQSKSKKSYSSGSASSNGPASRRSSEPKRRAPSASNTSSASNSAKGPRRKPIEAEGADRLQKILAHAGVGSRRACEDLILQGRVSVGGQVIRELGTKVDPARISIAVDGQKVQAEKLVYYAVYKPKGYVSTNNDPSGRPRVLDILPEIPQRVYTVGRLDEMSVGLMLLTNDGELANKLAHPKFGVEKLYRVEVAGFPTREVLNQLTEGIWLAEGKVRAKRVRAISRKGEATILEMVLAEGKNREVRRMLAKLGHKVMRLTRVAVGPITVKGLNAGMYRSLTGKEIDLLRRCAAGEPVPMPWNPDFKPRPLPDRPPTQRPDAPGQALGERPNFSNQGQGSRDTQRPQGQRPGGPPRRFADDRPPQDGPPRRFDGARPNQDGPGRRPDGYQPNQEGPPRRFEGPRPNQDGPPRRFDGARPQQDGPPRRAEGYRPNQDGPGRRPDGHRPNQDGPPRRPEGYRPNQDGPPRRPDHRAGGPQGSGPGGRPQQQPYHGGPRMYQEGGGRPSGDRPRNGERPNGRPPMPARRSNGPASTEPRGRKVIGMDSVPTPAPEPMPPSVSTREDRPKPRMKRPEGRKPMPRPSTGPRPMPLSKRKRRPGDDSEG